VVELGATRFDVIGCGGHTHGHVCYHRADDEILFAGDVLFAMGCGRLFEGTPAQMWSSLSKLAALPPQTLVYCAHEYTAANARFALSIDNDPAVRARAREIFRRRARGERTVPTTIGLERATNSFLRAPLLKPELDPVDAFALLRKQKDAFRG
jgi:hydroxyacylglutathione hydrolase